MYYGSLQGQQELYAATQDQQDPTVHWWKTHKVTLFGEENSPTNAIV